jgi:hypothetical protein
MIHKMLKEAGRTPKAQKSLEPETEQTKSIEGK